MENVYKKYYYTVIFNYVFKIKKGDKLQFIMRWVSWSLFLFKLIFFI